VLTFESFGVRLEVSAGAAEDLMRIRGLLPPGSRPYGGADLEASFELTADENATYELRRDGETLGSRLRAGLALEALEREIHSLVALKAPDHIFLHAGVVGYRGAALVVPGESHAGKTSLVAALVRAGAEYYSDEFAPLDPRGQVHPFAKPLSIRNEHHLQVDHPVAALGGVSGREPLPVGAVAVTTYEPGTEWVPRRLSAGDAVLALLAHAVPAQSRPTEALRTISRALEHGAIVIEGARGEANAVAPLLLAELERAR
jgi:hypothetical protein